MTPIQCQITITPSAETAAAFVDLLRKVQTAALGIDEEHEASVRASRYAHLGSAELSKDNGLDRLVDVKETASLLGLSPRTVYRLVDSGKMLKPIRLGQAVRWNYEQLRAWIDAGCPEPRKWERTESRSKK